ncbi:Ankyrin 2 [Phytophthora cinnamomi]|uniref:Ankyrin 2 n=1 Tax=Phytophthora cinnamomi TaxID=4785 RepID=UPI00355A15DD|nr:Ankyrin 2 [Phytophthora cinnamomi]
MSTTTTSFRPSKPNCRHSVRHHQSCPPDSSLSSSRLGRSQGPDHVVHLSLDRKAQLLQLMKELERDVLNSIDHEAWKLRMSQRGISYYVDDSVGKGLTRFCCVGRTDAPVADIMKMFMVSNTETLLKNVRVMYRNVKEARILSVVKPATPNAPHQSVYIRYASFDTPILMNGRDICVCVCTNMIEREDGSTVGYCLWESVDIPECPDRSTTDKIIRSRMWRSGYVLRNSGKPNALTKVRYIIGVEIGGFVPKLTGRVYMSTFGGNCRRVCEHYRKRSLDPETFTSRENWTPKGETKTVNPFEETIRPFAQTIKPSSNHTRHSQQLSREPRQHPRPSQQHASRPARRNNQSQQALRHSVATLRPPRSSSEVSRPSERPSQHLSNHRVSSFQHSMGPSRPVSNHRVSHQPLPGTPMTLSDLVTEESTDSNDNSIPLTMELTPRRQREVIARMKKSVKKAIDSMLPDSTKNSQWKLKLRKKDISCYVDETTVKPGQTRFCCVSHTHATVDEVMSLFLSTDKETQLRNNRLLYDNMLENRVLTELREPTKERPMNSMNVRYSTYQTPGPLANRQMCLVMATDMVRQPDGSMIGYCLWDSIEDPEFAKAKKPGLEVCTMFRSGFFVRRSGRRESSDKLTQGQTKIVYMVGMEHAAWASGLTARFLMEKYGNTLGRICSHLRRKNFDSQTFVMKTQWASKISAKSCKQCEKPFQVLSNRVNCHACGQVVCRSCTSKESVEIHGVGIVPTHICFWCLEKAGLPAPAPTSAQKHRKSMRIKRLESDTAVMYRASCQANAMAQQREHSVSVVNADLSDDDEDRESGEWAITTQGIPVQA